MLLTAQRPRPNPVVRFAKAIARGFAIGLLAVGAVIGGTQGTQDAIANGDTRTLSIRQMHTGETLTVTFRRNGRYDDAALRQLNWIMRDWRSDAQTRMDPRLFDALWEVHRQSGSRQALHVVSAYRSPQTNAMLRRRSRAVAESSQHTQGRAVDFYLPDVSAQQLRDIGMRLQRGGVGFYPRANTPFVHIDVGSVRHWPRMTRPQLSRLFPDGRTVHLPADGKPMPGFDEARRQVLAAGGTVFGESGSQIASASPRQRSLWSMLFGTDQDASDDEAYAELPTPALVEDRVAIFRQQPTGQPARPAPEPAPVAARPAPAPAPAPVPVAPPAPVPAQAPAPPIAIAEFAPAPLPPVAPDRSPEPPRASIAAASPQERAQVAALAEAAAAVAQPSQAGQSFAALPPPAPRAGEGVPEDGPRLLWVTGPAGRPGAIAPGEGAQVAEIPLPPRRFDSPIAVAAAVPAVEVAAQSPNQSATMESAPLPPSRADRPVLVAAAEPSPTLAPESPPVASIAGLAAFAPAPPARTADVFGSALRGVASAPQPAAERPLPVATASTAPARAVLPTPVQTTAPPPATATPALDRAALAALFATEVSAPAASSTASVRTAAANLVDPARGPRGYVSAPAAGLALGFTRERSLADAHKLDSGPAVRQLPRIN